MKKLPAFIAGVLLVSCSPAVVPAQQTASPPAADAPLPSETAVKTAALPTHTPAPSETPLPTETATRPPWEALGRELSFGDWYFRCEVTGVDFAIVEILPGIDAIGFLVCGGYRIPAGILDRTSKVLYYWGLLPIENPEILNGLGERAVFLFMEVFRLDSETILDTSELVGRELSLAVNLPNSTNSAVFDTQNIGRFAGEYWGSQEAVDLFAQTGSLPNPDNILYPISLGVVQ